MDSKRIWICPDQSVYRFNPWETKGNSPGTSRRAAFRRRR